MSDLRVVTCANARGFYSFVRETGEASHPVLGEASALVYRGNSTGRVLLDGEVPVSFNVTRPGKKKTNGWEPYANWYTAYTVVARRREGFARILYEEAVAAARAFGCRRLKALAGTMDGLLLHVGMGDQLWGVTDRLEVVVDTPLVENPAWAGRTPPNATRDAGKEPWSLERILERLDGRPLRYER